MSGTGRGAVRRRSFQQVDVFSPEPRRGNPVAVVLDGEGLTVDAMVPASRAGPTCPRRPSCCRRGPHGRLSRAHLHGRGRAPLRRPPHAGQLPRLAAAGGRPAGPGADRAGVRGRARGGAGGSTDDWPSRHRPDALGRARASRRTSSALRHPGRRSRTRRGQPVGRQRARLAGHPAGIGGGGAGRHPAAAGRRATTARSTSGSWGRTRRVGSAPTRCGPSSATTAGTLVEDPVTGSLNASLGSGWWQRAVVAGPLRRAARGRSLGAQPGACTSAEDDRGAIWVAGDTHTLSRGARRPGRERAGPERAACRSGDRDADRVVAAGAVRGG